MHLDQINAMLPEKLHAEAKVLHDAFITELREAERNRQGARDQTVKEAEQARIEAQKRSEQICNHFELAASDSGDFLAENHVEWIIQGVRLCAEEVIRSEEQA